MIARVLPLAFAVFVAGGLLSGAVGLRKVSALDTPRNAATQTATIDPDPPPRNPLTGSESSLSMPQPVAPAIVTPNVQTPPAHSSSVITEAPDLPWRLLYVVDGNLWETDGTTAVQVTEAGSMWQPAFGDSGIAFVQRSRNASDIWLATGDTAVRPLTHDASSSASLSHWATQPVFVPGKQSMYVLGDFNKSNTGVGDLAVWELNLQGEIIGQVTRPPAYAGGDQDVTVNPTDPRQLIFTRYSYAGTQLSEQLQWLNVTSGGSAVPLTRDNQASRQASYSPDGTQIAFVQAGPGQEEDLYVARVDVSGNQPELTNVQEVARGVIANPTWTPDGTGLAYVALTGAQFQVWALDIRTDSHGTLTISQPRQMTHGPEVDASSRPLLLTVGQANQLKDWLAQSGS